MEFEKKDEYVVDLTDHGGWVTHIGAAQFDECEDDVRMAMRLVIGYRGGRVPEGPEKSVAVVRVLHGLFDLFAGDDAYADRPDNTVRYMVEKARLYVGHRTGVAI